MTPYVNKELQNLFKSLVAINDMAANIFYNRLFDIAPEMRSMCPKSRQAQNRMFLQFLCLTTHNENRYKVVQSYIKSLGVLHQRHGVTEEHYKLAGSALLFTLEKLLGKFWTPALQEAWAEVYTDLIKTMRVSAILHAAE